MYSKIKDIRTQISYKFIRFGHIEHGPHVLGKSPNGDKIKIPLNDVDFLKD